MVSFREGKFHLCYGLNSHYFHTIGDGHQPNSRGLYTHYKDSLWKVGWPSPQKTRLLTMAHLALQKIPGISIVAAEVIMQVTVSVQRSGTDRWDFTDSYGHWKIREGRWLIDSSQSCRLYKVFTCIYCFFAYVIHLFWVFWTFFAMVA